MPPAAQARSDHVAQRSLARSHHPLVAAVCIDGAACDDGVDALIGFDARERFQHHHGRAFPAHKTIGLRIQGTAAAGRREHAEALHHGIAGGREHQLASARERDIGFPGAQHAQASCTATRPDAHAALMVRAGALAIEMKRDAIGSERPDVAENGVAVGCAPSLASRRR